jgi:hypothetical protein
MGINIAELSRRTCRILCDDLPFTVKLYIYLRSFDYAVAVNRNGGNVCSPSDFVLCMAAKEANI